MRYLKHKFDVHSFFSKVQSQVSYDVRDMMMTLLVLEEDSISMRIKTMTFLDRRIREVLDEVPNN